jgi:hypothetical protein
MLQPIELVMLHKLRQGSEIRILFLDPRSNLISRLAAEEGQTRGSMLADLATSLGICHRLYKELEKSSMPPNARLHIKIYDEMPYFAYHRDGDEVIVGFYFTSALGSTSGAFEVIDPEPRRLFEGHFAAVYSRASDIIEISQNGEPKLNYRLYGELRDFLTTELGQQRAQGLLDSEQ